MRYYWKSQFGANKTRKAVASSIVLKNSEKSEIKKQWPKLQYEDFWFKWYKKACIIREDNEGIDLSDVFWKYIPDDIYFKIICPKFQDVKACDVIDDKNLYDLYFHDIAQPITFFRKLD